MPPGGALVAYTISFPTNGPLPGTGDIAQWLTEQGEPFEVDGDNQLSLRALPVRIEFDHATIMASVGKTRRALIVDEGWRTGSISAEISARIMEQALWSLDAPVGRVCAKEVPIPYPKHPEDASIPQTPGIVAAAKAMMGR